MTFSFFFQHFKDVIQLLFACVVLMKSLQSFLLLLFCTLRLFFPLCCVWCFPFVSGFQQLCHDICLAVVFFVVSLLGFAEIFGFLVRSFHQIWKNCSHYFSTSFSSSDHPTPHLKTQVTYVETTWCHPTYHWGSVQFLQRFSPLCVLSLTIFCIGFKYAGRLCS